MKTKKKKNPMDKIYRKIAQAQIGKDASISVPAEDEPTIENILNDANLIFEKNRKRKITEYILQRKDTKDIIEILLEEYYSDEIPERGDLF